MSLTKVTYSMIEGAYINVLDYGATGDGVTDDRTAVQNALNAAASSGKTLFIPSGTYLISNILSVELDASSKDLAVVCDPSAVLKASSSFPADIKLVNIFATAGEHSVSWTGGKIDARLMPTKVGVAAPDAMTIGGGEAFTNKVLVQNVYFLNNDTLAGTAGDSCLFVAGCSNVSIINNVFQGATDLGIYISGAPTTFAGERIYVAGNTFIECVNGVGSKRNYKSHIIEGNFFRNCTTAVFVGGETEFPNTAQKAVISNNVIQRCVRGIEARVSDGAVISGNRIEDYGLNLTTGLPVNDTAILVSGSNNCIVTGNVTLFSGAYTPTPGATAVRIQSRTIVSTTYTSQYNLVTGNTFEAPSIVNHAAEEVAASGSDNNVIINNLTEGFAFNPPYRAVGANTNIGQKQLVIGANPVLTIQDTETTVGNADVKLVLGESGAGGVLDQNWAVHFDGADRVGLAFKINNTRHFRINGDAVSVNVEPTTTPSIASAGDVYYDSGTNKLRCYNGSTWNDLF